MPLSAGSPAKDDLAAGRALNPGKVANAGRAQT